MGLDAVEIIMDVEDHFGISIQNNEAERIRTVGDLVTLIQSRIAAAHSATCPTLSAFLRLRSCTRDISGNAHLQIRTATLVADTLNSSQRNRLWRRLESLLGSQPPSLRRPFLMRKMLVVCVIGAFVFAIISAVTIDFAILPLTLACAGFFAFVLHILTLRFRTQPPDQLSTFGAIAKRIAGTTVATERLHLHSFEAILDELRPIVADTLGTDASKVVASSRFVEDLGMG